VATTNDAAHFRIGKVSAPSAVLSTRNPDEGRQTVEVSIDRRDSVTARLVAAGCVAAEEEAGTILAAAPDDDTVEEWVARREQGEPLAWITGTVRFCGRDLRVDPGVFVPRPQTEELARHAGLLLADGGRHAADLCTGAGAVAAHLAAEVPETSVVGVDIDPIAVACARRNGVRAVCGDLGAPLRTGAFDVVTAVAPYVPTGDLRLLPADVQRHEPRAALDGGPDGLDTVRRVVREAGRLLRAGGWLLTELGGDQDRALEPALTASGFSSTMTWSDEDGELRGLATRRSDDDRHLVRPASDVGP
jgi:release factor glutamine methyltransferase